MIVECVVESCSTKSADDGRWANVTPSTQPPAGRDRTHVGWYPACAGHSTAASTLNFFMARFIVAHVFLNCGHPQ